MSLADFGLVDKQGIPTDAGVEYFVRRAQGGIGLILTGFGIRQIGLSLKSHDPSQRANGFLTLAGGVIITFAKEILNLIIGS